MLYWGKALQRTKQAMEQIIIDWMNQFGYFGIALLIAVENIFPPIPSEVILTLGGFMTTYTQMSIPLVILCSTIGSMVGAWLLYGIGRLVDESRLARFVTSRWGKVLRLKESDIHKAKGWFDRRGKRTVFLCRFVPIVRSLISIPAGMAHMPLPVFSALTLLGTAIWNTVLVILGAVAGASWDRIAAFMGIYAKVGLVLLLVGVLVFAVLFYKKRLAKKDEKKE